MWDDSQTIPEGMQLLLPIPTGHDMRRLWHDSTWTCVPESVLKHLRIPDYQKDFLFWPGIPNFLLDGNKFNILDRNTKIVNKNGQLAFNDFYAISEQVIIEFETGNIYEYGYDEVYEFSGIGIPEFLMFSFIETALSYNEYLDCIWCDGLDGYNYNSRPPWISTGITHDFYIEERRLTELFSLIDLEQLHSTIFTDHGYRWYSYC